MMKMKMSSLAVALLLGASLAGPAAAQAFSDQTIHEARLFFQANSGSSSRMDCITTLNAAVRQIFYKGRRVPKLGSRIDRTFAALQAAGMASGPTYVDFVDEAGRTTTGATTPVRLRSSIFDAAVAMCRGLPPGWHVLGLSMMDGYHAVTLVVDTRRPGQPWINWADQYHGGGWQAYARGGGLDEHVLESTTRWYAKFLDGHGVRPRTRVTLWRLKPPGGLTAGLAGAVGR